jgi:DNA-binding GntR family transcriptional regulator
LHGAPAADIEAIGALGAFAQDPPASHCVHEIDMPASEGAKLVLVKGQSLHAPVVEAIQQMIIEGVLAPGARLNERLLCERFGVSRTPLREAFKILAARGLVDLLPNRGALVAQLSRKAIAEHFEVISRLEAMSGELACVRMSDDEFDEIRALHFEMLACHARRDLPNYYRLNQQIHDSINAAARNEVLRETYATLNTRVKALRLRSNLDRDQWDAAVREHGAMIEALESRNGAELARVLERHVLAKRDVILAGARDTGHERERTG